LLYFCQRFHKYGREFEVYSRQPGDQFEPAEGRETGRGQGESLNVPHFAAKDAYSRL